MARPSPSCAHDDDRLRLPPASPPSSNSAEKKESTVRRLSQLCPPCAAPSSNSSLDYRRSDARIVEDGFAASSGVSKSAKVVLGVDAFASHALFLGPTVFAKLSERAWIAAAWSIQVAGRSADDSGWLDLTNFERHQARLLFGFTF
jgi:hypothetical protein